MSTSNQQLFRAWLNKATCKTCGHRLAKIIIAEKIGYTSSMITRFMQGKRMSAEFLIKLSKFTGLKLKFNCLHCGGDHRSDH